MFFEPGITDHGLPYDPFKACVVPRPIGWISTISGPSPTTGKTTANLAPFSQFNNLTFDPPYVMFAANHLSPTRSKDTVLNARATGVFCWQLATWPLRHAVNQSAEFLSPDVDEFDVANLGKTWSQTLDPPVPMVKASPVRFECRYHTQLTLPGNPPMGSVDVVIGRVVGVHIDDSVLTNGKIDVSKTQPIARMGYYEYAVVREKFEMIIPGDKNMLYGLEGSVRGNREAWERKQAKGQKDASEAAVDGPRTGETEEAGEESVGLEDKS